MNEKKVCAVIPARWQSSRFPGKPLALIKGKPMIQWVFERASMAKELDNVFVATDDPRIMKVVQDFGGNAILTSTEAKTGSERIAETLTHPELIDSSVIINIQGDEPLIKPELIDEMVRYLLENATIPVVTAATPLNEKEVANPNIVKVVSGKMFEKDKDMDIALYFSRSVIPFQRNKPKEDFSYYRHIGIYGYQKIALEKFSALPKSVLEDTESLEQLRMLESGWRIGIIFTDYNAIGIDTPEDIHLVEKNLTD